MSRIVIDQLRYRPCGACGEYVPADTGCKHWSPGGKVGKPQRVKVERPKVEQLPCNCDKVPGPPGPHRPYCQYLTSMVALTRR